MATRGRRLFRRSNSAAHSPVRAASAFRRVWKRAVLVGFDPVAARCWARRRGIGANEDIPDQAAGFIARDGFERAAVHQLGQAAALRARPTGRGRAAVILPSSRKLAVGVGNAAQACGSRLSGHVRHGDLQAGGAPSEPGVQKDGGADMSIREQLIERFFRYVAIESQSDAKALRLPSTPGQQRLAELLAQELRDLGLDDVAVDDHATVTALKRGTVPGAPRIGFIAHLDTFDAGLSPQIRPQLLRFEGEDLCLNREQDIWLRLAEQPQLGEWRGADIIAGDGTSVLGADNKAAIAVIMTLLGDLGPQDRHGDILVALVPDEEIGLRGAKALDLARFACDFAYTIDSCGIGEVVYENFNAAAAEIVLTGVSAHPMSAKGLLVNPVLMAHDFIAAFDRAETPENTEGREGYVWFNSVTANASEARLGALIRDFDREGFAARKLRLAEVAAEVAARYPTGSVDCRITDTYGNIQDSLGSDRRSVELLFAALEALQIRPRPIPMRGGTDGAALSARGLPTPNFFTGAYNFHSRYEYLPVPAFEKSFETARMICRLAAEPSATAA